MPKRRTVLKLLGAGCGLLVVVSAATLGWKVRYERRLLGEIREVGSYSDSAALNDSWRSRLRRWQGREGSSRSLTLSDRAVDDAWLSRWNNLALLSPTHLDVRNTRITGNGLAALLLANPHVMSLDMRGGDISDATIDAIARHPELQWVDLRGTNLTDAQLASLSLSRLNELCVAETLVTPAGLEQQLLKCRSIGGIGLDGRQCTEGTIKALARLRGRRRIELVGNDVTDEHLDWIGALDLSELELVGTSATDEAQSRFRATHPGCLVHEVRER